MGVVRYDRAVVMERWFWWWMMSILGCLVGFLFGCLRFRESVCLEVAFSLVP